jgi:hypothetical protein
MKPGSILIKGLFILSIAAIFASCGTKTPEIANMIPKDASFVMSVDGGSLAKKSGIEDLTETKSFLAMKEKISDKDLAQILEFEELIKDPTQSGIAIDQVSFLFANGHAKARSINVGYAVELSDVDKFESIITKQFEKNGVAIEIIDNEGIKHFEAEGMNDDVALMWTNEKALFILHQGRNTESTKKVATTYINNKKDNSVASISDFQDFYANKKDVSVWLNYNHLQNIQQSLSPRQLKQIDEMVNIDFSDCYVHLHLNFGKGKVEVSFESHLNKQLEELYKDYPFMKESLQTEVLNYMPQPALINFAFGIDLFPFYQYTMELMDEKTKAQIKMMEVGVQAQLGMNLQEALESIGGDLIINIHDFNIQEYEHLDYEGYWSSDKTDKAKFITKKKRLGVPKYTASLSINDEKLVKVLLTNAGDMLKNKGDYFQIGKDEFANFLCVHKGQIFVSNELSYVQSFLNGEELEESLIKQDIAKLIEKKPAYASFNMDIEQYPQAIQEMLKEGNAEYFGLLKNVSSIYEKAEFIPNDTYSGTFVLWLKNDKYNSLHQIMDNADKSISTIQ